MPINSLKEIIDVNDGFKNAINLYLNLNKTDKMLSYIPTKSSVKIIEQYTDSILENKGQASVLIGAYGKGKSHLLLVLLAIFSLDRTDKNSKNIVKVIDSISNVDNVVADKIRDIWFKKKRFLPIIISNSFSDLNQAFLLGLNDALKRDDLENLSPTTYYSAALECIVNWEKNYRDTFEKFTRKLEDNGINYQKLKTDLQRYNSEALGLFRRIYPELTSGSVFNPMTNSEILPLYKSVNERLCEEHGYAGIYIIFDEFSKFIEGKDQKAVGNDMKLLQDICELAQESKKSEQIFITLVTHKSVKEYGNYLSNDIINSFTGIEGRIEERYFITSSKNNYELIQNAITKDDKVLDTMRQLDTYFKEAGEYFSIPAFKTMFEYDDFYKIIVRGCYPLNPLSAYILLNVSEKVAQNERTLFTFISKDEPNSMARYIKKHDETMGWLVNADVVYDYFKNIFKKDIANTFVHNEWLKAEYAIENAISKEQIKMLKCLALINIVNKSDELPAKEDILTKSYGHDDAGTVLDELVANELVYVKGSNQSYAFKTSIGAELKNEIKKRRLLKNDQCNISTVFTKLSGKDFEEPKQYNQEYSMTRFFKYEFIDYEAFFNINSSKSYFSADDFCDGKILVLVPSETDSVENEKILNKIEQYADERIVVLKPGKKFKLKKRIQEYEILQDIRRDKIFIENNKVLLTEIEVFEEEISDEINYYIDEAYGLDGFSKAFYYSGTRAIEYELKDINKLVSRICINYYSQTPIINNELINKQNIKTSPIKKARKQIIEYILSKSDDKTFYLGTAPESTIYRAVFVKTNIIEGVPEEKMQNVLREFSRYIENCNERISAVSEIMDTLTSAPYGMRKGVLPLYFAYILSLKSNDLVIYFGNKEVQLTADIVLNMCENPDNYFVFISKESIEKERYIDGLQLLFNVEGSYNLTGSRINNILTSMQRWFRSLPQVTRIFKKSCELFKDESVFNGMLKVKPLLQKADANPYEILFKDIPQAFECEYKLDEALEKMRIFKNILDQYLDWLIQQSIKVTIKTFVGKEDLNHVLKSWYYKQSEMSKQGLYGNQVTGLMNLIQQLETFDDSEIIKKVIRVVSETYVENWNDESLEEYEVKLKTVKTEIESIRDSRENDENKKVLTFIGSNGNEIKRYYDNATESTGNILRSLIADALEDFSYLSVNDKTAILVEMLEKILK